MRGYWNLTVGFSTDEENVIWSSVFLRLTFGPKGRRRRRILLDKPVGFLSNRLYKPRITINCASAQRKRLRNRDFALGNVIWTWNSCILRFREILRNFALHAPDLALTQTFAVRIARSWAFACEELYINARFWPKLSRYDLGLLQQSINKHTPSAHKSADRFRRLLARSVKQYCLYSYGLVPSLQAISALRVSATKTASKSEFLARKRHLNMKISSFSDFAKFY